MYNERCSFFGLVFKGFWFDFYIFVNLGMKYLQGMLFIWVLVLFFFKIRNYESDLILIIVFGIVIVYFIFQKDKKGGGEVVVLILNCISNIFDNQNSMYINYIE